MFITTGYIIKLCFLEEPSTEKSFLGGRALIFQRKRFGKGVKKK